jgi:hypothetical protein
MISIGSFLPRLQVTLGAAKLAGENWSYIWNTPLH